MPADGKEDAEEQRGEEHAGLVPGEADDEQRGGPAKEPAPAAPDPQQQEEQRDIGDHLLAQAAVGIGRPEQRHEGRRGERESVEQPLARR